MNSILWRWIRRTILILSYLGCRWTGHLLQDPEPVSIMKPQFHNFRKVIHTKDSPAILKNHPSTMKICPCSTGRIESQQCCHIWPEGSSTRSLEMIMVMSSKFLKIWLTHFSVWLKNGTYRGSKKVDDSLVTKLIRFYPNVLYATQTEIGFFKTSIQEKSPVIC